MLNDSLGAIQEYLLGFSDSKSIPCARLSPESPQQARYRTSLALKCRLDTHQANMIRKTGLIASFVYTTVSFDGPFVSYSTDV